MRTIHAVAASALLAAALSIGGTTAVSATSPTPAQTAAAKPSITIKANMTEYEYGGAALGLKDKGPYVVTGKAKGLAGTTVKLQRELNGSGWATKSRTKVKKNGTFTLKDRPHVTELRHYRVVGVKGAVSNVLVLDVWFWEDLTRQVPVRRDNFTKAEVSFAQQKDTGLVQTDPAQPAFSQYFVEGSCRSFAVEVGLDDSSQVSSSGTVSISKDDTLVLDQSLRRGSGQLIIVDVTDAERVRIDATTSADPKGFAAIRRPHSLCQYTAYTAD